MDMSWSQTPSSVWWALEASVSTASLTGLGEPLSTFQHGGVLGVGSNFYDFADESELEEDEEQLVEWVKEHNSRGIIRYTLNCIGCLAS